MQTNNKLREALSAALEQVNKVYDILSRSCVVIQEARQGCREARGVLIPALDAPTRNCDRFASAEEAWDAYDKWVEPYRAQGKAEPFNEFGWLFAPATEQKGGSDGRQ